jgi:transcription antitermination factor NusG
MNELWHVIRTTAHREHAVALSLSEQGIRSFCPMQILTTVTRGQFHEQYAALFLTYVFAYFTSDDPYRWHEIMNTSGVIEILGGGEPTPVEPGIVESWIARANDKDIIEDLAKTIADLRRGYKVGDEVRLLRGMYTATTGTVAWIDDATDKVGVKISMLGRFGMIIRGTTELELVAHAPEPFLSRRGHRRSGRRGHRARVEAYAKYWNKHLP